MRLLQAAARHAAEWIGRESRLIRRLRPAYEATLDTLARGRGIPWTINGVTYRVDPRQRHRLAPDYDAPVAAFFRERVKPGAVCLDVGANVGVYVLQFGRWSSPGGQVIAFEPNPHARAILRRHVAMNDLTERVRIVAAAVGEAAGEQVLYAGGADGMSRLGEPNRALQGAIDEITVPVVTLDDYCESARVTPDWLLIDIEGFEIAALFGAQRLIRSRGAKLGIVVEMHPNVWDSANTTEARATALLDDLGLHAVPLTGQRDPLHDYGLVHLAHR